MLAHTDGIVLVDKGEGETSSRVVQKIRRSLKIKKAGHAGTLDPFATGLLIILLGQGTKLSSYLMSCEKAYLATIKLGEETDTLDLTGRVLKTMPVPEIQPGTIEEKAKTFLGEIDQVPPAFSALKYKGRRAYDWARKGLSVDLQKRKVNILSLKITAVRLPEISMEVICSKGTYIRSLAADFGKSLGPGGHLKKLRRLSTGLFKVDDAISSNIIGHHQGKEVFQRNIIPMGDALPQLKGIQVDDYMARRIRNGLQIGWDELATGLETPNPYLNGNPIKVLKGNELVAIIKGPRLEGGDSGRVKLMRVFN